MISIPLPFVVSMLLAMVFCAVWTIEERPQSWLRWFLLACTLASFIVGVRWATDWRWLRILQPIVASTLPALAWFSFMRPTRPGAFLHALPIAIVCVLSILPRNYAIVNDGFLSCLFLSYGGLLLWAVLSKPQVLGDIRLSDYQGARHAGLLAASLIIFSGLIDLLIAFDSYFAAGAHIGRIVSFGNLLSLPVLALALLRLASAYSTDDPIGAAVADQTIELERLRPQISEDHLALYQRFADVMISNHYYRDPNLTLNRLARRMSVPSRQLSTAINLNSGKNVSQAVNGFRIDEAKRLLVATQVPITEIMFESGFQTKSNFNREFMRITGMSPSDYRRSVTPP